MGNKRKHVELKEKEVKTEETQPQPKERKEAKAKPQTKPKSESKPKEDKQKQKQPETKETKETKVAETKTTTTTTAVTKPKKSKNVEEDFPRGGAVGLTPLEYKEVVKEAEEDLFKESKAKKPKKKQKTEGKSAAPIPKEKSVHKALNLKFKKLQQGSLLLGSIKEINELHLSISLPNNLTGHVSITDISNIISDQVKQAVEIEEDSDESLPNLPNLSKMFRVGQLVRVCVTELNSTGKHKKIDLSMNPVVINIGTQKSDMVKGMTLVGMVQSVEEHGYVISFGNMDVTGFLKKKDTEAFLKMTGNSELIVGQLVDCLIVDSIKGRVVPVSLNPQDYQKSVIKHKLSFESVKPGALVEGTVMNHLSNGILVKFLDLFEGTVQLQHLGALISTPEDIQKLYALNSKISLRVIFVDPSNKHCALSCNPNILSWEPYRFPENLTYGLIVNLNPVRVDPNIGVQLSMKGSNAHFYVHKSRVSDEITEKIDAKRFPADKNFKARIVSYDYFDGIIHASLQQSILEKPFLNYGDIKVGEIVKGEIMKVEDFGVLVKLTENVKGLLPPLHLADIKITKPSLRFKVDAPISCMVLQVDPKKRKMVLTHKKTLMQSTLPKILSYEDCKPGTVSHGFIISIKDTGCVVKFFNNVKGFVPKHELGLLEETDQISETFKVGQVVQCRVVKCDLQTQKVKLSLKMSNEGKQRKTGINYETESAVKSCPIKPGTVVEAVVTAKETYLEFDIQGFKARITSPSKKQSKLKVGSTVEALILDLDLGLKTAIISLDNDLITKRKALKLSEEEKKKLLELTHLATIQNVKQDYIVTTLNDSALVVYCRLKEGYLEEKKLEVGQNVTISLYQNDFNWRVFGKIGSAKKEGDSGLNPSIKSLNDVKIGMKLKVQILSVKNNYLHVKISKNVRGVIEPTEIIDTEQFKTSKDFEQLVSKFEPKSFIDAVVVHKKEGKLDEKQIKKAILLSIRPSHLSSKTTIQLKDSNNIKVGEEILASVLTESNTQLLLRVSPIETAMLFQSGYSESLSGFKKGSVLKLKVSVNNKKKIVLVDTKEIPPKKPVVLTVGDRVTGVVEAIHPTDLQVKLDSGAKAFINILEVDDKMTEKPFSKFKVGSKVDGVIISKDKKTHLSLRKSIINPEEQNEVEQKSGKIIFTRVDNFEDVHIDQLVGGYVKAISTSGCFISLSKSLDARSKIADLSDDFLKEKDFMEMFKPGKFVIGRVLNIDANNKSVDVSLKRSAVDPSLRSLTFEDLKVGQKVKGIIIRVEKYGILISLENSRLKGLCHKTEVSDSPVDDLSTLYSAGDRVKAIIVKLDNQDNKKRISFGLKHSYFTEEDEEDEDDDNEETQDEEMEEPMDVDENDAEEEEEEEEEDQDENEDDDEENENDDEDDDVKVSFMDVDDDDEGEDDDDEDDKDEKPAKGIEIPAKFEWEGLDFKKPSKNEKDDESDEDDEEEEEDEDEEKSKKKNKNKEREEKEKAISQREKEIMDSQVPQTAEDYERLVLSSPNSSFLWVKYMAYQLDLTEIEKARAIAERALKVISFREEQEKMNIWVAYMNLENSFGTQDSLMKVFNNALQQNDPKKIYIHLANIYERTGKEESAEQLYQTMCNKFRESSKIWTMFGLFKLKHGKTESARSLLQKAIKLLPKRKHIKTICKFAQMEFKYGEAERGRTIFEGIMDNYPKRVDLWSIYLDLELRKVTDVSIPRKLLERLISMKWSSKKMKYFFKRYLDFEKTYGDESTVEHVKEKAREYVESGN